MDFTMTDPETPKKPSSPFTRFSETLREVGSAPSPDGNQHLQTIVSAVKLMIKRTNAGSGLKGRLNRLIARDAGRAQQWVDLVDISNAYEQAVADQNSTEARSYAARFVEMLNVIEADVDPEHRVSTGYDLGKGDSVHRLIVDLGDALCELRE